MTHNHIEEDKPLQSTSLSPLKAGSIRTGPAHDDAFTGLEVEPAAQASHNNHNPSSQQGKKRDLEEVEVPVEGQEKVKDSASDLDPNSGNILRDPPTVLRGWQLRISIFGLSLGLFLSALETTIVATALIKISEAFKEYDKAGWIVVSYMLTYTGFLIVYAKLSDIFGKKNMMLLGLLIFTLFSILAGVSQTITQLIIFRAFQGLGASGIYSMVSVIVPTIVSIKDVAKYMAVISSVFVLSSVLGPVVGGAITDKADWRWVFWLNGPAGSFAFLVLLFSLPVEQAEEKEKEIIQELEAIEAGNAKPITVSRSRVSSRRYIPQLDFGTTFTRQAISRIDLGGTILSLAFSILLVFALQEGGVDFLWSSSVIISTLTVAVVCFFLFILWEEWILGDHRKTLSPVLKTHRLMPTEACEPIFPMRLTKHRVIACLLLTGFLTGFPFMTALFNLPQRFQTVNQLSATASGIRLFPLLLSSAFATAMVGVILKTIGKGSTKVLWYLIVIGSVLQFIGITLIATALDDRQAVRPQQYVFQAILGCGVGFILSSLVIACRVEVAEADMAVVMGAIVQVRVLGGCIALAVCSALLLHKLEAELRGTGVLSNMEMERLLKSTQYMRELGEEKFEIVREVYAEGYALQMKIMIAFSGAAVVTALGAWKREWKIMEGLN